MDQVSRPMQIALVAVVLLAGIWFTVLRPKPAAAPSTTPVAVQPAPVAPGVKGLTTAVQKAKGAVATSRAANARAGADSVKSAPTASRPSATKATAAKPSAATPKAAARPAPAAAVKDPSQVLLSFLAKGKTIVLLFHADGADDLGARRAVHKVALTDKHVVTAYADISKVGLYQAITSGIDIVTTPTVLVIGKDRKATILTDVIDAGVIEQAVGDARRVAAKAK